MLKEQLTSLTLSERHSTEARQLANCSHVVTIRQPFSINLLQLPNFDTPAASLWDGFAAKQTNRKKATAITRTWKGIIEKNCTGFRLSF